MKWINETDRVPKNDNGVHLFYVKYQVKDEHIEGKVINCSSLARYTNSWLLIPHSKKEILNLKWLDESEPLCKKAEEVKKDDLLPYTNTAGLIVWAKVTALETVDSKKGKVWFHGIDTKTQAKVYYPVHASLNFLAAMHEYASAHSDLYTREQMEECWNAAENRVDWLRESEGWSKEQPDFNTYLSTLTKNNK